MKKALSLALTLMMLMTLICTIPVTAAAADGSAANPYHVATPMSAPSYITIPANSTVYYQYKVAVFNGWEVGGYGLSAITVDGVVYDTPDMWGEIYATFNFKFISRGLVGYVNDTDEDIEVMINHNEPVGSESNPDKLVAGENTFSIPANNPRYVAEYYPTASGEYTFECAQTEDFIVSVEVDGTSHTVNGSLTLEMESYIPVRVYISAVGNTPNVTINLIVPKAGTESNPIWLGSDAMVDPYTIEAGSNMYFQIDGFLGGNDLCIESVAGADFTAFIAGAIYDSLDGKVTASLPAGDDWYIDMVLTSAVDNEVTFKVAYAAGSDQNPIVLEDGTNAILIPENSYYYYSYTAKTDGLLVLTPAVASQLGLLDIGYEDADMKYHYGYLAEGASFAMLPIPAGQTVTISACGAMDEETFINRAIDTSLHVELKDLLLYNTFEGADSAGDLEGWQSTSELALEETNVANGFYSAAFNVTKDWGNVYRYINVEANTNYEISFKAMATLEKGMWVKLHKDDWSGDVAQADVNLTTEWADYTVTLNSGDNTTLVMLLQYNGYAADGQSIWLDDIVVTKVAPAEPEVTLGDLDGNGKVNNRDLGLLQLYLNDDDLSDKTFIEAAGDLDGNGKLNNRDLGLLQKQLNQ